MISCLIFNSTLAKSSTENLTVDTSDFERSYKNESLVKSEEQSLFYLKSYMPFSVIRGGKYRNWCQKVNCEKFHRNVLSKHT